jgi:phenylalanyl-tRNA synthetase beta chain
MRAPISWLGEFVDLPDDVTLEHVHAALVRVGLEEEDVHTFDLTGPIVVGQVLAFEDELQSNGKTIRWCQVDVGEGEPRGIVCGAHNFVVGDKVVVSLPGAVLPGPFPISARKTYGHVSDGMIASARELGLGDEHDGILRLQALGLDPEVGVDAISLLGLDDFAVEVNVTPDRGYAFSIRGIAREYSNSTGAAFRDPADDPILVPEIVARRSATGIEVTVDDAAPVRGRVGVTTFTTGIVRGVNASWPTPPWMVSRLLLAGIRSISLIVDISNYVMLELGQPIHTYDLSKVQGGLTLRRAADGETLETLDGKVRSLSAEDFVVADQSGPIGLAGVMGGASTEISTASTDVLVEAGIWDPVTISRTVRRHKLPSEAAKRYERGVDPRMSPAAVARVMQLLVELGGGTADPVGSFFDTSVDAQPIELPAGFVKRITGAEYTDEETVAALEAIGATVEVRGSVHSQEGWTVTPPSWRPDLTDATTLVEEVARIVGYDRIPSVLPVAPPGHGLTRHQRLRRMVAQSLADGGYTEVLSYPFVGKATNDRFGRAEAAAVPAVKLANPLDPDAAWLRTSLIPGLIQIARRNLSRGLTDLAIAEVGIVFQPVAGTAYGSGPLPPGDARPDDTVLDALRASIPPQPWHVGALVLGDAIAKQPGQPPVAGGLAEALDVARQVALAVSAPVEIATGHHQAMHPGRTAELRSHGELVGYAGELLPSLAIELDLPRVVGVVELDLDALIAAGAIEKHATPISGMPAATQDVSLVVARDIAAGDVRAALIDGAGDLLEHVALVDDYRGPGVDAASKSLTFALRFRAPDRTLTAAEATEAKTAAVAVAAQRFGAALRE